MSQAEQRSTMMWQRLVALEPAVIVLAIPLLAFPERFRQLDGVLLGFLLLLWVVRRIAVGRFTVPTPLDLPITALFFMVPVSLYASANREASLPKLTGLILGAAVFLAIVNHVRDRRGVEVVLAGLAAGGCLIAGLSLLGTRWSAKFPVLAPLQSRLPRVIQGLPRAESGFNANEVGGALILIVPVIVALAWLAVRGELTLHVGGRRVRSRLSPWLPVALATILLLTGGTLLLSQSRSSLFGFAVALAAMIAVRNRTLRWAGIGALIIGAALVLYLGPDRVGQALLGSADVADTVGNISFAGRKEIWQRSIYMLQDFPFTGIGLNTFPLVASLLYPFFLISPDVSVPHAHNIFLQVGVDLGIPGLVAYVGLLTAFGVCAWKAYKRHQDSTMQLVVLGLGAGILAHHVYGLTDAITLGAKPGFLLWAIFGLVAAIHNLPATTPAESRSVATQSSRHLSLSVSQMLTLILGLALVLRLGAILALGDFSADWWFDWELIAKTLVEHGYFGADKISLYGPHPAGVTSFIPPVYPFFLAAMMFLFAGRAWLAIRLVQAGVSVLAVFLVYALGREVFRREEVALLGAFLAAVYPPFVAGVLESSPVSFEVFLMELFLLLLIVGARRPALRRWVAAGFVLGVAALLRATILAFVPFLPLCLFFNRRKSVAVDVVRPLLIIGAVSLAVIAPWTARNYRAQGEFIFISSNGGVNFWIGNNEQATGEFINPRAVAKDLLQASEQMSETGRDRLFFQQALSFIRQNPRRFVELLGTKLYYFLWVRPSIGQNYQKQALVGLAVLAYRIATLFLLPLWVLGIALTRKLWRRLSFFYFGILAVALVNMLFFVGTRYRTPAAPYQILFAAAALMMLVERWKPERQGARSLDAGQGESQR